jgi:molybdopterin-guanine dinucleotide biosynthesis protein A
LHFVRGSPYARNRRPNRPGGPNDQRGSPHLNDDLTAIVLAGGRSSRFGSNKALARLHGVTFLDRVLGAARDVCPRAVVVLAPAQPEPALIEREGVTFTRDLTPHEGPLAGVIAGLEAIATGWALVASCDAPLVQSPLLALLAGRRAESAQAVLADVGGRLQPFPAVVSRSSLPRLRAAFEAGERRIDRVLEQLPRVEVPEATLRFTDPQLLSFRNVNSPEDLAALELELSDP